MAALCLFSVTHLAARGLRGLTALHYAVDGRHGSIVELLLKHNADIEAKTVNGVGPSKGANDLKGGRLLGAPLSAPRRQGPAPRRRLDGGAAAEAQGPGGGGEQ